MAAALGAPLVSFLLAGLLLICPLLIWVPFGRRPDRRDPGAGGEEP